MAIPPKMSPRQALLRLTLTGLGALAPISRHEHHRVVAAASSSAASLSKYLRTTRQTSIRTSKRLLKSIVTSASTALMARVREVQTTSALQRMNNRVKKTGRKTYRQRLRLWPSQRCQLQFRTSIARVRKRSK